MESWIGVGESEIRAVGFDTSADFGSALGLATVVVWKTGRSEIGVDRAVKGD